MASLRLRQVTPRRGWLSGNARMSMIWPPSDPGKALQPTPTSLVRQEIEEAMEKREVLVEPRLDRADACSIHLRPDSLFGAFRPTEEGILDPGPRSSALAFDEVPSLSRPFFIQPSSFVLAQILGFVALLQSIAAHFDGRSSVARRGIVFHATAGWIDPGWREHLTIVVIRGYPPGSGVQGPQLLCR